MAVKKYILTLQISDNSCTAILINRKGKIEAESTTSLELTQSHGGISVDGLEIIYSVRSAINSLLKKSVQYPKQIHSIALITNARWAIAWNRKTGVALTPALSGQHPIALEHFKMLTTKEIASHIRTISGSSLRPDAPAFLYQELLHRVKSGDDIVPSDEIVLSTIDSWIAYHISGRSAVVTDYTTAAQTLLFDHHKSQWDTFTCGEFDFDPSHLAKVCPSHSTFGKSAGFVPLPDGIPLSCIVRDKQAQMAGLNRTEFGGCMMIYERNGTFMINSAGQVLNSNGRSSTTVLASGNGPQFAQEVPLSFPDALLNILVDERLVKDPLASYEVLSETSSTHGVYVVPDEQSERYSVLGLSSENTSAHVLRAFFEAISFQVKNRIIAYEQQSGQYLREVCATGSYSQNEFLTQFQADVLQMPIITMEAPNAAVVGAAMIAGNVSGWFKDDLDRLKLNPIKKAFHPSLDPISSLAHFNQWKSHWDKLNKLL
jgi:glycerol kinase